MSNVKTKEKQEIRYIYPKDYRHYCKEIEI